MQLAIMHYATVRCPGTFTVLLGIYMKNSAIFVSGLKTISFWKHLLKNVL
jgi:hypothetical protein